MKSIMIVFNQASTERVEYLLDTLEVRGFTFWENVLTVVPDEKVEPILTAVRKLDKRNEEVGIRAFAWNIEQMV